MNKHLAATLFAVAFALAAVPSAWAQAPAADVTDMQALRQAVAKDKKAYVASVMNLTEAEAKKFWPVYDAYQRDLDMSNRQRTRALEGLIGRDKPLTDLYARNLGMDLIAADETEVKARRTISNRLLKPLPGRTIMPATKGLRYLQLESKIRVAAQYDLAAGLPLIK